MTPIDVMQAVKEVGGALALNGDQIKYKLPKSAAWLVTEFKLHRKDLIALLRRAGNPPAMPRGVRLLKWEPKNAPIAIVRIGIVSSVHTFIAATLLQLQASLEGKDFLAGNLSVRELVDRLEQVGVMVKVERTPICQEEG